MTIAKKTLVPSTCHVSTTSGRGPASVTGSSSRSSAAGRRSPSAPDARRARVGSEKTLQIVQLVGEDPPADVEELSDERLRDAVIHRAVRTPALDDALLAQDPELLR